MKDFHKIATVTIANNAAVSDAFVLPNGYVVAAVLTPSTWTAADIGLQFSVDGTTFVNVYSGVGTTTARARVTGVPTSESVILTFGSDAGTGAAIRNYPTNCSMKLTSINTASNADVNQGGARSVDVYVVTSE